MVLYALNNQLGPQSSVMWRTGLIHAGDKGKRDAQNRRKARPIVVGLALRRIAERIPCAQMKDRFARVFTVARQLGVAVSSGVEAAWHTVMNGID